MVTIPVVSEARVETAGSMVENNHGVELFDPTCFGLHSLGGPRSPSPVNAVFRLDITSMSPLGEVN
jgi:hypothetical protein